VHRYNYIASMDRRRQVLETRIPRRGVTNASGVIFLVREAYGQGESREMLRITMLYLQ